MRFPATPSSSTRPTTSRTPARRFGRGSFAAVGAAAALVGALGLAGDAPGRTAGEPIHVRSVASQTVAMPDVPPPAPVRRGLGVGEASYYHDSLAGNPTASGTPYRPAALTAAHRTLPLGSKVRVTDLDSGRSVVVEVNDRGPFAKGRVIDLSRAAARQIGLIQRGHADVRLEIVG